MRSLLRLLIPRRGPYQPRPDVLTPRPAPKAAPVHESARTAGVGAPRIGRDARGYVAPPRPKQKRWRIPWRGIALATSGVLGVTAAGFGAYWLVMGDTFRVRDVQVAGVQVADPYAVAAAANVTGDSMLFLDLNAIAREVAAVPGVQHVRVSREWPRGLVVNVTEYQGWGYWQVGGDRRVIDENGRLLDLAREPAPGAPTIVELGGEGELAPDPDTVRLIERMRAQGTFNLLRVEPEGFVFRRDRGLTIVIDDGPDAVFGDSHNFDFKVASWGALLDRLEAQPQQASEIDLRFGRHLVLR